jgi:hypothetical protein
MKYLNILWIKIFAAFTVAALGLSCASNNRAPQIAGDSKAPTPVYDALSKYERDDKVRGPLGGDWNAGAEIFKTANGATEAQTLIARGKNVVLLSQGAGSKVIGVAEAPVANEIIRDRKVRKLGIPETGEIVTSAEHKKYIEAATRFGEAFNAEMVKHIGTKGERATK